MGTVWSFHYISLKLPILSERNSLSIYTFMLMKLYLCYALADPKY